MSEISNLDSEIIGQIERSQNKDGISKEKKKRPKVKTDIIDLSFSSDSDADDGLKRKPKEKGTDIIATKEVNISKRFKDGKFLAYDVSITLGRQSVVDKKTGLIRQKKNTIKRSFQTMQEAITFRDVEKGRKSKAISEGKHYRHRNWTVKEVISLYEADLLERGKTADYISDKKRYGKHALLYFNDEHVNDDRLMSRVSSIEVGDVSDYLRYLYNNLKRDGSKLAYKSLEKERAYIFGLWQFMLAKPSLYNVSVNVASGAKIPEQAQFNYAARDLTYIEIQDLIIEACKFDDPSFLYLVVFSITQGMRRGELCGLKWGDVNFDTKRITIRHNRIQSVDTGKNKMKEPKTGKIRDIEMHKVGLETMLIYKAWQEELLGRSINDEDFVLMYEVNLKYGYEPHTGKISRKWKETYSKINKQRIKKNLNEIPYGRLHDGRHCYASLLLNGVQKENGDIVRHASYIQVYESMGHSLPKVLQNTTTGTYREDTGARFEVTAFWNDLFEISVKGEWDKARKEDTEEWEKLTEVQRDRKKMQKQKRMEKAYAEKLAAHSVPEELVEYTEEGYMPGFEEDGL